MNSLSEADISVFESYPKYITHLRQAYQNDELVIAFGTEFASEIGIPNWRDLLNRAAVHPAINAEDIDNPDESPRDRQTRLYNQLSSQKDNDIIKNGDNKRSQPEADPKWVDILRDCLYNSVPEGNDTDQIHPYFSDLHPLINDVSMIVSYGIDSGLQLMLSDYSTSESGREQYWTTTYDSTLPQPVDDCVIYQSDGYLPKNPLSGISDTFAFPPTRPIEESEYRIHPTSTEDYLFTKRTLLILEPELVSGSNLEKQLRRTATTNPAQIHYAVEQSSSSDSDSQGDSDRIDQDTFENHNLLTMQLGQAEIQSLIKLIRCDKSTFKKATTDRDERTKWIYYVTGVPGVGKTSTINHFFDSGTIPEWSEEPPEILKIPFTELSPSQENKVDRWIAQQYAQRNDQISAAYEGIFIVDRAPLDPVIFASPENTIQKSDWYREQLQSCSNVGQLANGEVIVLHDDPEKVACRLARRQDAADDPQYLQMMADRTNRIYDLSSTRMVSKKSSLREVVKAVSNIIFRHTYAPSDLDNQLSNLQESPDDELLNK